MSRQLQKETVHCHLMIDSPLSPASEFKNNELTNVRQSLDSIHILHKELLPELIHCKNAETILYFVELFANLTVPLEFLSFLELDKLTPEETEHFQKMLDVKISFLEENDAVKTIAKSLRDVVLATEGSNLHDIQPRLEMIRNLLFLPRHGVIFSIYEQAKALKRKIVRCLLSTDFYSSLLSMLAKNNKNVAFGITLTTTEIPIMLFQEMEVEECHHVPTGFGSTSIQNESDTSEESSSDDSVPSDSNKSTSSFGDSGYAQLTTSLSDSDDSTETSGSQPIENIGYPDEWIRSKSSVEESGSCNEIAGLLPRNMSTASLSGEKMTSSSSVKRRRTCKLGRKQKCVRKKTICEHRSALAEKILGSRNIKAFAQKFLHSRFESVVTELQLQCSSSRTDRMTDSLHLLNLMSSFLKVVSKFPLLSHQVTYVPGFPFLKRRLRFRSRSVTASE